MTALPQQDATSSADYLAFERSSEGRHELVDGQIVAMSGASRKHVVIVSMAVHLLVGQLRGKPCEVYSSDMRVKVSPTGLYTYPDVAVMCGEPEFEDDHIDTLLNPTVIIEVLSPSTELYDRGDKFRQYRQLGTLQDYVLVAQDKAAAERYSRQSDNQWLLTEAIGRHSQITLPSIKCTLALNDLYERVTFDE